MVIMDIGAAQPSPEQVPEAAGRHEGADRERESGEVDPSSQPEEQPDRHEPTPKATTAATAASAPISTSDDTAT